jgi:2-keto-4-pentenoate hydratase/2-oxohepta-3-ene-1,7-dioic acid hydratase in catechol pathway
MKIFCIGRNYVAHAEELGNEVPDAPVIFMKPPTALVRNGKAVYYPPFTKNLHYEGELVVRILKNGKSIKERFARDYYKEVTLGFDLTARDIQSDLKKKGLPWDLAKGFDGAAPLGSFIPLADAVNEDGHIRYRIFKNGEEVQFGDTSLMIFPIDQLIVHISRFFTLRNGDLIFTGTPAGVGPLKKGDELTGEINGRRLVKVKIR